MQFIPSKINRFLMFKLPAAWIAGVRVKEITDEKAVVTARHKWINQNPFQSMYFAVLAMGAELSTGILVMKKIQESNRNTSMLVTHIEADFTKKARGKIRFVCEEGNLIDEKIKRAVETGEGVTFNLNSKAFDEKNDMVCHFVFQWSIKRKA